MRRLHYHNTYNTNNTTHTAAVLPEPSSDLWDLVLDLDWPRVEEHARNNPRDVNFVEGHWHETPLYLACQHDPPFEAVRAIVEACPESVTIASRENKDLPIHIACRYGASPELLEVLLRYHPETATESTKWGRTPLATLWEFRETPESETNEDTDKDTDEVEDEDKDASVWSKVLVLLSAIARVHHNADSFPNLCPEVLSLSTEGVSDLDVNPDSNSDSSSSTELRLTLSTNSDSNSNSKPNLSMPLHPAPFLAPLQATDEDTKKNEQRIVSCVLHAAVTLGASGCPAEVLSRLLREDPQQLRERDQWGRLPLHVAIQRANNNNSNNNSNNTNSNSNSNNNTNGKQSVRTRVRTRRHRRRRRRPREGPVLERLLEAFPGAARCPCGGGRRFPLHEAIASGHSWSGGVGALFAAAPGLLAVRDPVTGLWPFALAACRETLQGTCSSDVDNGNKKGNENQNENENENDTDADTEGLETAYELLRAGPDVLTARGEGESESPGTRGASTNPGLQRSIARKSWLVSLVRERLLVGRIAPMVTRFVLIWDCWIGALSLSSWSARIRGPEGGGNNDNNARLGSWLYRHQRTTTKNPR